MESMLEQMVPVEEETKLPSRLAKEAASNSVLE